MVFETYEPSLFVKILGYIILGQMPEATGKTLQRLDNRQWASVKTVWGGDKVEFVQ